jgi:septal ring factor EnvC (AmiA/AmiB activator)
LQQEVAGTRTRLREVEAELRASRQAIARETEIQHELKQERDELTKAQTKTMETLGNIQAKLEEKDAQLKATTEQIKDLQAEKTVSRQRSASSRPMANFYSGTI